MLVVDVRTTLRQVALIGILLMAASGQTGFVLAVRTAMASGNLASADGMISEYRKERGITPELILAESWIGRGLLDAGQLEGADKHAADTRTRALDLLAHRKLDADAELPEALGASIEVHAQVLAKQGAAAEAVSFLRAESARWRDTSIRPRIQKNLNLLTLEGKPAPAIDITRWTGDVKPQPLASLQGHPVLIFFWAHWCVDCKAEASVLQDLLARYGSLGLRVVGPTMHYGFAAQGEPATLEQETAWIEATRKRYYARVGDMPVPVSEEALRVYGVSTTPTLVLLDRYGIIRLYHPGRMSYQELAPQVAKLLQPAGRSAHKS